MPTPPDGFRHYTPIAIRYADMDTLGHVNNAKYATYLEQARILYINTLGLWDGQPSTQGLIVARVCVDYKLPLGLHDGTAHVWTRIARIGTKSLDFKHQVLRADGAVAAAGDIVVVAFDYAGSTSIAVPEAWRAAIRAYEPGSVA